MDINVLNDSNTEIPHDITEIAENIVNINTLKMIILHLRLLITLMVLIVLTT